MIDFAELEKLAKAATPGPWRAEEQTELVWGACDPDDTTTYGMGVPLANCIKETPRWARDAPRFRLDYEQGVTNAAFIAAANPQAILELLATLREQREALEEIADLAALSVVGGDDFDRGARAARLEAAEIARAALTQRGG